MLRLLTLLSALAFGTAAAAQGTPLQSLETRQDTQGWEAVGRLDIGNTGFCTGALIRDRLVLTAAHCVYDEAGDVIPADQFVFQAGLRNGRADATRRIVKIVTHPAYIPDGPTAKIDGVGNDIAVLELAQPIRYSNVRPYPVSSRPRRGDEVAIVSYGRNRSDAPSLQKACNILSRVGEALVMDCEAEFGSSGAPVFSLSNGQARIVSVVSAVGNSGGQTVSLGTSLQDPLQELLAEFAARGPAKPGGTQRLISIGERNDTGARFVKVGE